MWISSLSLKIAYWTVLTLIGVIMWDDKTEASDEMKRGEWHRPSDVGLGYCWPSGYA